MFDKLHLGCLSPKVAFALVSFALGELGDGLNIFQGIYLVELGWNEGSVGAALSLMGLTALIVQTFAGDIVDKTTFDRRLFLCVAAVLTAMSASTVMFVREGNRDHHLIYFTKVVEGIASSFIGPCLAALTLASFGPDHFDAVMASNILWGHVGAVISAVLAGAAAYALYPDIKYCFLVIAFSALVAVALVPFVPQGDPLMGRGFRGAVALDEAGQLNNVDYDEDDVIQSPSKSSNKSADPLPEAASYWSVFGEKKTLVLCVTGFFFHFANANVLLVLGELMGGDNDDGSTKRSAIPLTAGAIVMAQFTMSLATLAGDRMTDLGWGRKPLFMIALLSLPIRCALIVLWKDAGDGYLVSTQILDGVGGGFFGLLHPYMVADITFGTGRFNVLMGLTASCFGLGATMSNFLGQLVVQEFGHVASLLGSLMISFIPILVFAIFMPETLGRRGHIELEPVVLSPIKKFRKSLDAGDEGEHLSIVKGVHNYEGCV
eukprot:CAMPEP_0113575864 /NCGR_PEP_ID=MMETSP0015_2-20120614/27945_1 /TAXON_ID=2838 /ORGANISM="Odontella" /LENGTH=489 /DNA_ID=CAMNT_0000479171 /DNA_START=255 /DNA_END=1724 /DNA_ORIENTATION=- /assembly_acc=CAM_ASM_000160